MERHVYFDHNATTPLHPEVKQVISETLDLFGNPSSLHEFGRASRRMIEEAREKIAGFINADPEEVIFVGSGSEANNTVLSIFTCSSSRCSCGAPHRKNIITTTIEHPCIIETSKCLAERGTQVKFVGVDPFGKVDRQHLEESLNSDAGLVSVMMANNEIGTLQDIKDIAASVHAQGALFHTDAVQAVGKIPVDVRDLDVDFLTLSGHKIYGPKGIGTLYVRRGVPFCPMIRGGHQEKGRRAGTENTLGILGLAKAIEMRQKEMDAETKRLKEWKDYLTDTFKQRIPDSHINGHPQDSLPNTLNISFSGAEGEAILLYLDLAGIAVSTGSTCASGFLDPSHVLLATGLSPEQAHGSIRISMGRGTTRADVEYLAEQLPQVIARVRSMSSAYAKET